MKPLKSLIFYQGPSVIDGSDILGILTGIDGTTSNRKTGRQIQSWILPAHTSPMEAVKAGADAGICGDCPNRWHLNGSCYVLPFQAPQQIWKTATSGRMPAIWQLSSRQLGQLAREFDRYSLRLGAYGDPGAIPESGWLPILDITRTWTGFSHQWMNPDCQWLRGWCMASVESLEDAKTAQAMDWRSARTSIDGKPARNEMLCLNYTRKEFTCEECIEFGSECNGWRKNVVRPVHGKKASKFPYQKNIVGPWHGSRAGAVSKSITNQ